jgi:Ca-activated chloride channel family protein
MTRIPSILLCLSMAAPLAAQPLFRSAVDLVTIPVTVTGRDASRPAGELSAADFRIFEDGVAQQIALVSHVPRPISLCILLDSSPSMASGRQALASRTIDALLAGLKQDDEATLLFFASKVRTVFPWTRAGAIRPVSWIEWRVSLGTALVDALREALSLMERASNPVPVILVVSDGGENASRTPVSKLVASRRQSETLVYAVDTELPPSRIAPPVNRAFSNFLPELVGDSGGTIYEVKSPEAGENAARALLDELRAQYTLGYVPRRAADGTFRQIKVESTARGYAVRHRAGYLAEKRN